MRGNSSIDSRRCPQELTAFSGRQDHALLCMLAGVRRSRGEAAAASPLSEPARPRESRRTQHAQAPARRVVRRHAARVVDRMLYEAKVRTGDVVYDLGCGDGRMVIAAAKKFGTRGVGIDLDPARIKEARANAKRKASISW